MYKHSIKYGIACGVFLIILFQVTYAFFSNPYIDLRQVFFDLILFGIFIFFGLNEFKKFHNNGYLQFWQGMSIGFFIYIQAVIIFVVYQWILHSVTDSYFEAYQKDAFKYLEQRREMFEEQLGKEHFEAQKRSLDELKKSTLIWHSGVKKIAVGFFATSLLSLIQRRNKI